MREEELFFESETRKHQQEVGRLLMAFAVELLERASAHDASKLEDPERAVFIEYTPKLRGSTYGSDEYKGFLKEMKVALDHHYADNSHHPEHHDSIRDMDLADVVEMICDWMAACARHADGDIWKSIDVNEKRFSMDSQLANILRNTARVLGSKR